MAQWGILPVLRNQRADVSFYAPHLEVPRYALPQAVLREGWDGYELIRYSAGEVVAGYVACREL